MASSTWSWPEQKRKTKKSEDRNREDGRSEERRRGEKGREKQIRVKNQKEGGQLQQEKLKELSSDQVILV